MTSNRQFYDYVDSSGENQIERWLEKGIPKGHRAAIDSHLQKIVRAQRWQEPWVKALKGSKCRPLNEARVRGDVQYRPLFVYGLEPHEATILLGAVEKGDDWDRPKDPCPIAKDRHIELQQERSRTVEHRYRTKR